MVRAGGNSPAVWGVYILAVWMMLLTPLISSDNSVNASEHAAVSVQTKSLLQASLTRYLSEASSSDGGFVYVDRETAQRRTAYLSAQHHRTGLYTASPVLLKDLLGPLSHVQAVRPVVSVQTETSA